MRRRVIAGGAVALALFGSLVFAERGSSSPAAPISTKSIALSRPSIAVPTFNIPALPSAPNFSALLPKSSSTASGPSTQNFGFEFPGQDNTCDALLDVRAELLEQPQTPAIQAALAINALQLALLHCEQISGD